MIENIYCAVVILCLTMFCGLPFVYHMHKINVITKGVLSFVIGYVIISSVGLLANAIGVEPFFSQLLVLFFMGIFFFILCRDNLGSIIKIRSKLKNQDILVIALGSLYLFACLYFFDNIIMWMGGDAQWHASIIRHLVDGLSVPVSVYPLGSPWEYYPKGFHLYSYFLVSLLSMEIIKVLQVVPVIIATVTSLLIYSLVQEFGKSKVALYAFIIACFGFIHHSSYLIWAGYPAMTAEMLLVGVMLAMVVNKRFLPLLLIGIAFTHTRFLVYCIAIVGIWMGIELILRIFHGIRNNGKNKHLSFYLLIPFISLCFIASFMVMLKTGVLEYNIHSPVFFTEIIGNKELMMEHISQWYLGVLSVIGLVVAFFRRDRLDRFVLAWIAGIMLLTVTVDIGLLNLPISANRAFVKLYIPFSILAAYLIYASYQYIINSMNSRNVNSRKQRQVILALIFMLLLIGGSSTLVVFNNYANSWALPRADYQAMVWLDDQKFKNSACINIDTVGRWVYPLTGIPVSNPRGILKPEITHGAHVLNNPNSIKTVKKMDIDYARYDQLLVYISNVTTTQPGYEPPFLRHKEHYPNVSSLVLNETLYSLLYGKDDVCIFKYMGSHILEEERLE